LVSEKTRRPGWQLGEEADDEDELDLLMGVSGDFVSTLSRLG
jgi:hypothetical protein